MDNKRIIVVGGGLAGLMATIKICEAGVPVDLFSVVPVKRSHSVCAQGGINGAKNTKGEGDSTDIHFYDTVHGGDYLADQPPAKAMCEAAVPIIDLTDRMGVMYSRTPEGLLDFRRFGGTKYHRTAFAGATTGQQLLYALDEQVRRYEAEGLVKKYEFWEFLSFVPDGAGECVGITALNFLDMSIEAFPAGAVIICTGGPGMIFGKTTNSMINTGAAASRCWQQGAYYANPEMIQVHPTAIPGVDKLRLMSESARGEGGRCWVPKKQGDTRPPRDIPEDERWYFFEEKYPSYANLVPRDIASREIYHICRDLKMGVGGENVVYLDLTHISREELDRRLGGILEIYEKFVGVDPHVEPMKVYCSVHYSMGGMWIDYEHMTNVPGLLAAGEVDFAYHGANRLGANSLVSAIYGGIVAGPRAVKHGESKKWPTAAQSLLDAETKRQVEILDGLKKLDGGENVFMLHQELGEWMTEHVSVVRYNEQLNKVHDKIMELKGRARRIGIHDGATRFNQYLTFVRQFDDMLELARAIVLGALLRNESRGSHYKPEFPKRDDENWLKTTMTKWTPGGPEFFFRPVDASIIQPKERKYD